MIGIPSLKKGVKSSFDPFFPFYEMSGNASEWVLDWYDKKYYETSPEHNPRGPKTGFKKVLRGGTPTSSPSANDVYGRSKHWVIFDETNKEFKRQSDHHKRISVVEILIFACQFSNVNISTTSPIAPKAVMRNCQFPFSSI